jgi:hypothetical protein
MFKWLLDNSLTNRLLVIIASVVLMAYGAFTLSRTPVDVFPDLNKPTVTIMTEAGGMAAEEVEQLITFPLETTMNGLPGVESVRSTSSAGLSFLYVTFDWSTDIFRARQLVSERLSSMEEGIAEGVVPRMGPISSIMGEIMQIAIPVDPSKISAMAVREYADWVLRPRLLSVPGVAQVIPIGGEVRQFQVQPNTTRMAELGITHDQLEGALKGYSSNTSGGFLELNGREYLIRNLGRTSRLDDLKNLALTAKDGQPILMRQIAEVTFAAALKRGDAGYEGKPAVILGIQKQPTADTIALTKSIEDALVGLKASLPAGMEAPRVTFRQASFIEASITTLQGKLIGASIFVAVILFFFLGTLRPTIIALTAIPGVDLHHRAGLQVLRPVDQHDDAGRPGHRHWRTGRRRGGRRRERVAASEVRPGQPSAQPAAPDRDRRARNDGSAVSHPVCDGHHRARLHPAVRAAGTGGQAVRAAGHRLHRVDAGLADRLGDGDAGAQLLPAAAHEEPGPRRHQGPGLAEGALPQQPAGRAGQAQGCHGGGGCCRVGGRSRRAVLPDDFSAAVQRGHAADRPAAEPRRDLDASHRHSHARPRCWSSRCPKSPTSGGAAVGPNWTNTRKACTSVNSTWASSPPPS